MNKSKNKSTIIKQQNFTQINIIVGVSSLLLGIFYYFLLRPLPLGFSWLSAWFNIDTPLLTTYVEYGWNFSIPSFIHVFAFSFLSLSIVRINSRNITIIGITWFLISGIFELLQGTLFSGTFDWSDMVAALIAGICFIILAKVLNKNFFKNWQTPNTRSHQYRSHKIYLIPLVAIGIVTITGSYSCEPNNGTEGCYREPRTEAVPVYMPYEELRTTAIYTDLARPLTSTGKIYLYKDYILVNSPNEGIHIYNNLNPKYPLKVAFINIPGNVDIAISQDFLYVDSYIDLVTIDIRDIDAPVVIDRQKNVFPYNPYQNISDSIVLTDVDQTKGVIVGYKLQ